MLAQKHSDRLKDLKKMVEGASSHFRKNVERYQEFMQFVFNTSLSADDILKLEELQKPTIEFNVLEAMVSRLRGEFANQEPGISVKAADGVPINRITPEFMEMLKVVEAHIRDSTASSSADGLQYKIYTDLLGGGFSVAEVYTDYVSDLSFDQKIIVKRVFDPTLTGFDPLARESHKGDGNFCFQLYPRTKEEFIADFGSDACKDMRFSRDVGSFSWSYSQSDTDVVLICDLYEKKKRREKIYKLAGGIVVAKEKYDRMVEIWNENFIEQVPAILETRWADNEYIVRYRFCENRVLAFEETDYKYLPLIFIDGNSVEVKDKNSGASTQMTRPYVYHAKGIQKLKNFSGQTVAAEIENMVQHKFKVALESIPEQYLDAYTNIQKADVLIYNGFYKGDVNVPLAPPMEIMRTPTPPIVESTFMGSDRVTQAILGSYDAVMGINQQDISGVAVSNGAIQSSAASTPYLMGYINGLNRIAQVMLDLIPKYYKTPRSLPVMTEDGKRSYQIINDPGNEQSISLDYKQHELNVRVEAGVNSAIQKQVALEQIIRMMQASPLFAQFINTEGLETILDNMDIRGIEGMKAKAQTFMEQQKKLQEEAAKEGEQAQDGMTQEMIAAQVHIEEAKIGQRAVESENKMAIETARLALEQRKAEVLIAKTLSEIDNQDKKMMLEKEKVDAENARSAIETVMELTHNRVSNPTIPDMEFE